MLTYASQISVTNPFISWARLFPNMSRYYCNVTKSRKKRVTKVDVPKLSDSKRVQEDNNANYIDQKETVSLGRDLINLTESSSLSDETSLIRKKQIKNTLKENSKKQGKEKKISQSSETKSGQTTKLSLSDRYGDSLNVPGMKPFSITKTKKDLLKIESSCKNPEATQEASPELNSAVIQESIDISEAIPKLRSPSFRLEQKLHVPSEWAIMAESWTPSVGFLKSILDFPIDGLQKSTNFPENTEYVSCFVTGDKNAAKVVPAVTTVLSKTMTPAQVYALKLWRERLTKQLGEEGFQQYQTRTLTRGKQFHDTIQRYLHGEPIRNLNIEDLPLITGCWKSLVPVLNRIDGVIAVESEVLHPRLLYRGVVDCIVEIKGQPFIVEWKHSSRKRESLQKNYDSPVQLMAYTGAINSNASYPFGVNKSLLVVAYEDGTPADVFLLSVPENGEHHWQTWLKRLHTYWHLLKAEREMDS